MPIKIIKRATLSTQEAISQEGADSVPSTQVGNDLLLDSTSLIAFMVELISLAPHLPPLVCKR